LIKDPKPSREPYRIRLYNRRTKTIEIEQVYGRRFMDLCYGTAWGRRLEAALLCRHPVSRVYGVVQNHPWSRFLIPRFIGQYGIDAREAVVPPGGFRSFNSFFSRRLKPDARTIDSRPDRLIAPADSRLQVFAISPDLSLTIKGLCMTLPQLLGVDRLGAAFQGGLCLCYRLAPCDYHRFAFVEQGLQSAVRTVHGPLHSVSPLAMRHRPDILATNYRQWCQIQSPDSGTLIQAEVGAMMVGSIVQHRPDGGPCRRGQEKGYFQFGGSTVLVLLERSRVTMDADIAHYSGRGIETVVRYGESVGFIHR
jgi:phosphatidylserine decarboxylase